MPRTQKQRKRRRRSRGFTLIELLVVLVILGLVAAVAVPRVVQTLGGAKADTARVGIEGLATALDLYRLSEGRYPSETEGLTALIEAPPGAETWNGPYVTKQSAIIDPWGRPYLYVIPGDGGRDFDLSSLGADGQEGGDGEDEDIDR